VSREELVIKIKLFRKNFIVTSYASGLGPKLLCVLCLVQMRLLYAIIVSHIYAERVHGCLFFSLHFHIILHISAKFDVLVDDLPEEV
jgi:hypothetical protein